MIIHEKSYGIETILVHSACNEQKDIVLIMYGMLYLTALTSNIYTDFTIMSSYICHSVINLAA